MSRAFLKEDATDDPVVIPPRAALPPGVVNYVTPRGLRLLKEELAELAAQRDAVAGSRKENPDRTRELTLLRGRIAQLEERIGTARLVKPEHQPNGEVRFGARVTLRASDGDERRLTLVGVDEADPSEARLAFTAPVAARILGRQIGDRVEWPAPGGPKAFEIVEIAYG